MSTIMALPPGLLVASESTAAGSSHDYEDFDRAELPPANEFEILAATAYIRCMADGLNREVINDTAKLIMHRLVARQIARNPSLIEQAKKSQAAISARFPDRSFVDEWDELLALPADRLKRLLASWHPEMNRLRLSSPFVTTEAVDFTDPDLRRRIRRAAARILRRRLKADPARSATAG